MGKCWSELTRWGSGLARQVGLLLGLLAWAAVGAAGAQELRLGGTGTALGTMRLLGEAWRQSQPGAQLTVLRSLGSGGGIKAILAGKLQIAVSGRPLTAAEIQQGARQLEYGRTPLVFVVSRSSTLDELSTGALIDLYAGKTTHWPDGGRIRLILRPRGEADSALIKSLSAEMRVAMQAAEQRPGLPYAVTDQEAADRAQKIPGAFATLTLAQLLTEPRALKALRFDQVAPSVQNLDNGRYPLYKRLYLVTGPKSPPAAQQFLAFVLSPAGREILRRTGHALP